MTKDRAIEEERLPYYKKIDITLWTYGAYTRKKYQVLSKLELGATSTVWSGRNIE